MRKSQSKVYLMSVNVLPLVYLAALPERLSSIIAALALVLMILSIVLIVFLIKNNKVKAAHNTALERIRYMFDTAPLGCNLWNENGEQIDANLETVKLFGVKDKQEYLDRFYELSPEYQPDGALSSECVRQSIDKAFRDGYCQLDFTHRKLDGTLIPTEVKLFRIHAESGNIVAGYIRDLREHNQMIGAIEYQNKLLITVNRVSATLLEPDVTKFEDTLYKAMSMIADAIDLDRLCIWKNYTKGGRQYCSLAYEWLSEALLREENDDPGDLSFDADIPGIERILPQGTTLNRLARDMPSASWAHTDKRKILALFLAPVYIKDVFWGFFAFDDCHNEELFTPDEEMILQSVSDMMANALIRKEMTLDILNTSAKLEEAIKAANEANEAKSEFLAKVSHEIRTPMNAIIGMSELSLREELTPAAREYAVTVKQAGVNLLSIINDVLDFSKLESGTMQIIENDYSLSSLVNDVISIIRMRAVDSQVRFAVYLDSTLPNALFGDEIRIRQVLINLLGNAIKYTDEGYVSFKVFGEPLDENTIILSAEVADSGKGIKQEDLSKLFNDFTQLETDSNRNINGVGLGLSISGSLIEAMGGEIAVDSEYGRGSIFTVTLPQKISDPEQVATIKDSGEKSVLVFERRGIYADSIIYTISNLGMRSELAPTEEAFFEAISKNSFSHIFVSHALFEKNIDTVKEHGASSQVVLLAEFGEAIPAGDWCVLSMPIHAISVANLFNGVSDGFSYNSVDDMTVRFTAPEAKALVVDDIHTNLKVASGLLLPYGMEVDLCGSGAEAIKAVLEKRYDIVFMDHRMPDMDGVEATRHIRALGGEDPYYIELPIVALTANAIAGIEEMFLSSGFSDYLTKPIDTVKLNTVLGKWIPKSKKTGSAAHNDNSDTLSKPELTGVLIEGINVKKGVDLSGGTLEYFYEVLEAFLEEGAERKEVVVKCMAAGDLKQYTAQAHAIKGASANVGAEELSSMAAALEAAGRQENIAYFEQNHDSFVSALEQLLGAIDRQLASREVDSDSEDGLGGDAGEIRSNLLELRSALGQLDFEKINSTIDLLLASSLPDNDRITVRNISKHILMFEYDDAETLIGSLLEDGNDIDA